jgi:hypothetical protein
MPVGNQGTTGPITMPKFTILTDVSQIALAEVARNRLLNGSKRADFAVKVADERCADIYAPECTSRRRPGST